MFFCDYVFGVYRFNLILCFLMGALVFSFDFIEFCIIRLLLFLQFAIYKLIGKFVFFAILFDNKIKNFLFGTFLWNRQSSDTHILKFFKLFFENLYIFVVYQIIGVLIPCRIVFQTFIRFVALEVGSDRIFIRNAWRYRNFRWMCFWLCMSW